VKCLQHASADAMGSISEQLGEPDVPMYHMHRSPAGSVVTARIWCRVIACDTFLPCLPSTDWMLVFHSVKKLTTRQ